MLALGSVSPILFALLQGWRPARTRPAFFNWCALLWKGGGSALGCAVAHKLVRLKLWQTSLNVRNLWSKDLSSMLRTNSSDVWRGGWKRQRGEGTPLRVSLPAAVCLCSPGFTFLCAALRPLLLRLSAAGGHRPALSRFSGVPSRVSGEPDSRERLTPFTDKVPSGHRGRWLSDSFAAKRAARCGVRPLRWSVPQVERTTSRERWALSAPRRGLPAGSGGPGPEEPLLRWAHLWVQLRHHVSCVYSHTSCFLLHIITRLGQSLVSAIIYKCVWHRRGARKPVVISII